MEIKRISRENIDKIIRYNLLNGDGAAGLKTAAGSALDIADYVIFTSVDINNNAEKTILSLVTMDGEYFATNSVTCIEAFEKICEAFDNELPAIEFYLGKSNKGREFLSCRPAK